MTFSLPSKRRPGVQENSPNEEIHRRQIAEEVNRINQGQFNATLFVTLDPGATSTVVTDSRISSQTCAPLVPQTANAAAALVPTLFVTLEAHASSTTVTDARISPQTCASFMPQTASAAAEIPTMFVVCTNGSLTIHHTNSAVIDRTYTMGLIGVVPMLYVNCTNGSLTIHHTNTAETDRTYTMGIFG